MSLSGWLCLSGRLLRHCRLFCFIVSPEVRRVLCCVDSHLIEGMEMRLPGSGDGEVTSPTSSILASLFLPGTRHIQGARFFIFEGSMIDD